MTKNLLWPRYSDPGDLTAIESIPLPERGLPQSTYALLERAATLWPDRRALTVLPDATRWNEPKCRTFGELLVDVHKTANMLRDLGVQRHNAVAIISPNCDELITATLAAQLAGIAAPNNGALSDDHIAELVPKSGAQVLIGAAPELDAASWDTAQHLIKTGVVHTVLLLRPTSDRANFTLTPHVDGAAVAYLSQVAEKYDGSAFCGQPPAAGDLAALFHTGGTTGKPKPAAHTHANEVTDAWMIAANTLLDEDISSLRYALVGASALPAAVRKDFESHTGVPLVEGYGLTEGTCASVRSFPDHPRPGSVGQRLPYQRVKTVRIDDDGRWSDVPAGEVGNLAISGPTVFPGYVTGRTSDGYVLDGLGKLNDGWLDTGDLAWVDDDGFLHLTGRAKDLIIRGGHNIDPATIEDALLAHPDVTAAAAVGRPDVHAGEVPVAYLTVTPAASVTDDELQAWAPESVPVVIVGAGPTGVTAATLLADYGIPCLVLDRWESVYPQPRAVHLDDEINRIVARLGVAEEFAAISRPALGLRLLDHDQRVLAHFHRDTAESIHGFPQANMFDQPELEALLRTNLKKRSGVQLRGNSEVTDVTQHDPGRARVTFTDRVTGDEHIVDTAYVLGCDGANSVVRTSIGAAMEDLRFEQRWLVADVVTDAELNQWDGVHQVCNPARAATYMRIGPTRYRWEFRLLPSETADDYGTLTALRNLIAPWVNDIGDDDLELVRVTEYTFRAQIADRWRDRHVFLLGDAAHLTPPFIGQGMGAGLRDAMNLAWKLAGVITGDLSPSLLDTYEQERKPHARMMIGLALGMGWAMTAGGRVGNALRRTVAPRLHLIPGMRERIVNSRTPALHRSALVIKTRAPRQLAGTLCPNPVLADGQRLDTVLGDGFALVTTVRPHAFQFALLEKHGVVLHIAEPGSELARWLRRGRATAAIVRPDRTVMCAGHNLSALCAAMPRFVPAAHADWSER